MPSLRQAYAVENGNVVSESDLDPKVAAILRWMTMVAYVLDQHRLAVARHSRTLAQLRTELEQLDAARARR